MPVRKTFKLDRLELSYLEWPGEKPLLLLHGLADHGLVWSSLGEYLTPSYHSIAPDLRGHGESSKLESGYAFKDYIADLESLMDYLHWEDCHVLGHSWGAKLAAIWATKNPKRFRSLILVDPFFIDKMPAWVQLTFPLLYKILPFLKVMGPFPSYEAAEKVARGLKQYQGWSPLQEQIFRAGMEQKPDGSWGSKFVRQARDEIFEDVMRVAGLIEPLDIPTLFIKPQGGLNRTEWQLKPYRTYLTNLTLVEVPGNHWAFLVEPEAFNRTVREFLG
jgi:pimeloyl-ACP methyl ester carboxylesterase